MKMRQATLCHQLFREEKNLVSREEKEEERKLAEKYAKDTFGFGSS